MNYAHLQTPTAIIFGTVQLHSLQNSYASKDLPVNQGRILLWINASERGEGDSMKVVDRLYSLTTRQIFKVVVWDLPFKDFNINYLKKIISCL